MIGEYSSHYLVSDLDSLLKKHPYFSSVSDNNRLSIYNTALQKVWALRDTESYPKVVEMLTDITISNDTVSYPEDDLAKYTIYEISFTDIKRERKSLYSVDAILYNLIDKVFNKYDSVEKRTIFSIAQTLISSLRNRYKVDGYLLNTTNYNRYSTKITELEGALNSYVEIILKDINTKEYSATINSYVEIIAQKAPKEDLYASIQVFAEVVPQAILETTSKEASINAYAEVIVNAIINKINEGTLNAYADVSIT